MLFLCAERRFLALFLSILLWPSVGIAAEVYRWTNESGQTSFSDQPLHAEAKTLTVTPNSNRYLFSIKKVQGGDSLTLENGQRVRLLGLNAPEVSSRYGEAEPLGNAARDWLDNSVSAGQVELEYDQQKQDHYQRQLAYLWLADETLLNEQILRQGLASLTLRPPNLKYADRFIAAQQHAIERQVGI